MWLIYGNYDHYGNYDRKVCTCYPGMRVCQKIPDFRNFDLLLNSKILSNSIFLFLSKIGTWNSHSVSKSIFWTWVLVGSRGGGGGGLRMTLEGTVTHFKNSTYKEK